MIFHFCCNICKIFAEGNFLRRKISYDSEATTVTSLPRDVHGAPAERLVVKLMGIEYCPFKSIVAAVETLDIFVPACCNEYGVLYLLMLIYSRLHGHAIFGVVSVSDTCRTPVRVRLA